MNSDFEKLKASPSQKILFFSPYSTWKLHYQFEVPLAWNLLWRGHDVRFFTCDGLFPVCDIYRFAVSGERPANACDACQGSVDAIFQEYGLKNSKLGFYKNTAIDESAEIAKEIQKLPSHKIENFEVEGYAVYQWVISSFCTHLRSNGLDLKNPAHVDAIKKYLAGGWLAARLIDRMFDDVKPSKLVLFNGRQSYTRVAFELASRRGLPIICHERGKLEEQFLVWKNNSCDTLVHFTDAREKWRDYPLSSAEVLQVRDTIKSMSEGRGLSWRSYFTRTKGDSIGNFLDHHAGKKIWALFPSSTDESAANRIYWKAYDTQAEWITKTLEFVSQCPDVALIIRAHPNMGSGTSTGVNKDELAFFKKLEEQIPDNVLLIKSSEEINSYEILNHTDLGLIFLSTLSIEMACRGIPVIAAGNTGWANCQMVHFVETNEEYLQKLAYFKDHSLEPTKTLEMVKDTYRLAHAYYFKVPIKYPFLKQLNYFTYALDAKSAVDFQPSKHREIDRVAEIVLGNGEIVPSPDRLPHSEDFLEEETAVRQALSFFRHPGFVSDTVDLSLIVTSPDQLNELLRDRQLERFENSRWMELVLCNFSENEALDLPKNIRITHVFSDLGNSASTWNGAIRKSSGRFLMIPDKASAPSLEMIEKFLLFPSLEEDAVFYGDALWIGESGTYSVKPPPKVTLGAVATNNQIPSSSIFSRKIWKEVQGFRANVQGSEHWDFWLAASILEKKFLYLEALAERGCKPASEANRHPNLILNNSSAFTLEEIGRARVALGIENIGPDFTKSFGNPFDAKLANLKRIKDSGQKLTWATQELVTIVPRLFKLRCHDLCAFVVEEILAREPANPSALKIYADLLPFCSRKTEAGFVRRQIDTGARFPVSNWELLQSSDSKVSAAVEKPPSEGDFFGPVEVNEIKSLVAEFFKNPREEAFTIALRNLRMGLADHLMAAKASTLEALFSGDYGEVFDLLSGSGLALLELGTEEKKVAGAAGDYLKKLIGEMPDVRFLLLGMLFFPRDKFTHWPSHSAVPSWLRLRYQLFLGDQNKESPVESTSTEIPRKALPEKAPRSTRILFLTGSPLHYMAPPQFGGFQINAGPDWETTKDASGRWQSFKTRAGRYPIEPILNQIPPEEQPDILVCLVDASRRNMPTGIASFRGPKVLLVADTHHLTSPLAGMMAYAASEPFDRIAFLYDRHHIPFFQAAGFKNLFWLPGFTFPHEDSSVAGILNLKRQNFIGFVGQAGKFHPRRSRLLEKLLSANIPVLQKVVPQSQNLSFYASLAAGFNASLNGDLNLRVFEILASGAALLTDALGMDAGLEQLSQTGCRFETYGSPGEMVEKAKELLANPTLAAEIGQAGREWFLENLSMERRRDIFHRVAFDGLQPEIFQLPSPSSAFIPFSGKKLLSSIEVYEFVQEMHRLQEKVDVVRDESAEGADFFRSLPRVQIEPPAPDKKADLVMTTLAGEDFSRIAEVKHLWIVDAVDEDPIWPRAQGYYRMKGQAALYERKFKPLTGIPTTLDAAISIFAEGRLSEAEDICRELLAKDERCAGAWNLLGKMAALQGDLEAAGEFASVASDLDPLNAEFVRELAEVGLRKREFDLAEQNALRALEMMPDSPEGLVLLGRVLAEKDEKSGAMAAFQNALRLKKDYAEGFSHYAMALQKFGRGKDAISQIRKACALEPESVEFQTNLAILLEQNTRFVDALAAYGKAARMNPNVGFVWFRQAKLLNSLKRYSESIPLLEKAISLPGQLGDYYYEYGLALHMSKRFQEALFNYEKALSMGYDTAALHCNRGVIYKDLRKGGESIMAFHKAVTMDPSNVSYLNNLGAAALELGLNSEALDCFEQAVEKNPKLPTARNNIGNLLKDRARGMDALPQYRKSMELNPDDRDAPSNYLLCHMYISDMDPRLVFEEHKKWGLSTTKKFPPAFKFKPREAGAKIRVGFLSADLCHHPVAHFIEPIFRGYDRELFEFVAYGDQRKSDEFSARFATQVNLWRETCSYDDQALAKVIYEDRLDILFELAGHTAYNRLGVFALKPAPVQVSYLGYPGTTGLPTIDFRITDAFADPEGATEYLHTEKLIRVPECAWCFQPEASAPQVDALPAVKNGYITFGCFNNMAKLNPSLFDTWAEILLRVPGSHLRLKARTLTDDGVRKELKSYFTQRGIEEDRLDFFGHTRKTIEHLNHYHSVDIALDSFPYHGTTTTCEAMWMGCPVITRAGKTHVSRVGVSLLNAVGLQEFIAETREDYIEKAVALAAQSDRLQELRASMRERLRQSVLMDEKRFVKGFEKALLEMTSLSGIANKKPSV